MTDDLGKATRISSAASRPRRGGLVQQLVVDERMMEYAMMEWDGE